jgi:hypothetical protein
LELIKDYDLGINYHLGKANVVADALSRKSQANVVLPYPFELCREFERLNLWIVCHTEGVTLEVESTVEQDIRKGELEDEKIKEIKELIKEYKAPGFTEDAQKTVWFKKRICVPTIESIRKMILREAHDLAYSIHPGSTKMNQD